MWLNAGKLILRIYIVLWMTAVGGILGANLLAIIGMLCFAPENKGVYIQPWLHAGWYAGTALFFIGSITGRLRFINGTALGNKPREPNQDSSTVNGEPPIHPARGETQSGFLSHTFGGGLAGGILGLAFGASLLVFWFSSAYSPWSTKNASSSVKVVQTPLRDSNSYRNVTQTDHPVALLLCLVPAILGATLGSVAGGIISIKSGKHDSKAVGDRDLAAAISRDANDVSQIQTNS